MKGKNNKYATLPEVTRQGKGYGETRGERRILPFKVRAERTRTVLV